MDFLQGNNPTVSDDLRVLILNFIDHELIKRHISCHEPFIRNAVRPFRYHGIHVFLFIAHNSRFFYCW